MKLLFNVYNREDRPTDRVKRAFTALFTHSDTLSKTNMGLVSRRKKILKPKLKYYLFPLSD
jgi:hypothetical protein